MSHSEEELTSTENAAEDPRSNEFEDESQFQDQRTETETSDFEDGDEISTQVEKVKKVLPHEEIPFQTFQFPLPDLQTTQRTDEYATDGSLLQGRDIHDYESEVFKVQSDREGFCLESEGNAEEIRGEEEIAEESEKLAEPTEESERSSKKSAKSSSESTLSNVYSKLSPFFIKWSFGVKKSTQMINLTKDEKFEVFFASSHLGVIYDYRKNVMKFLPGHNHSITSISADASGRWLVTADAGEDAVIIIWDNDSGLPIWTLYDTFPKEGIKHVRISQDGRFLAAVNWGFKQVLKFWLWTLGREESDGEIELDSSYGKAKHIDFNRLETEQFAITMETRVIFCRWIEKSKKLEKCVAEIKKHRTKLGRFGETLFLDDNRTAITSTSLGQIVVWCDVPYVERIAEDVPGKIDKKYLKTVKIHPSGVTSLRLIDNVITSSSENGAISFFDQNFKLLYWVSKHKLDPILSVSFHVNPKTEGEMDPFCPEFDDVKSSKRSTSEEELEIEIPGEIAEESEKGETEFVYLNKTKSLAFEEKSLTSLKRIPSDCTIQMRPFPIRDFIFLTTTGKIGYVSHHRRKLQYFLYKFEAPILSLDCNPNKPHLVTGNENGRVVLYEYKTKELLLTVDLIKNPISYLKYSPSGHVLTAGLYRGDVLILDPNLLVIRYKLETSKSKIAKICFSPNSRFLAYYDTSSGVCLYEENRKREWVFMGKYVSHYKPICEIAFEEEPKNPKAPRLFTIGEDRMMVEYDTENLEMGRLKLSSIFRIEQTAVPCSFAWHPTFYRDVKFLLSNDQFKIKTYELDKKTCCKTTLGPISDTPVRYMKVISNWDGDSKTAKMIYATDKHIGIRKLPTTGNPFEGVGMIGHPEKITAVAVSHDDEYVFTAGSNDRAVLMWKLNPKAVDISHQLGGEGVEPFVPLIEGGPDGFLFRELQDFFYYAQIIHQGEHADRERSVGKNLPLCEIPDFLRALGCYPTDYEVDNLMYELKHMKYEETKEYVDEISFEECVKIYLNHRPAIGISLDDVDKALLTIADATDPANIIVEREELYKTLQQRGEPMSRAEAIGYLCILLLPKNESQPVPASMSLKEFSEDVLGIDLTITEENVKEVTRAFEDKSQ